MEKRKHLGTANKKYIKSFSSKIIRIDEEDIKGYASLLKVEEVHRPYMVGDGVCLYDNGYSELCFLPDNEHWTLWAIYDENGDIIEWYFDITRKNSVDESGTPYCDDLYLDAALMPDGQIFVFDEDELKDALDSGKISQDEFDMAYIVLDELKVKKIIDVAYMKTLCSRLQLLFI